MKDFLLDVFFFSDFVNISVYFSFSSWIISTFFVTFFPSNFVYFLFLCVGVGVWITLVFLLFSLSCVFLMSIFDCLDFFVSLFGVALKMDEGWSILPVRRTCMLHSGCTLMICNACTFYASIIESTFIVLILNALTYFRFQINKKKSVSIWFHLCCYTNLGFSTFKLANSIAPILARWPERAIGVFERWEGRYYLGTEIDRWLWRQSIDQVSSRVVTESRPEACTASAGIYFCLWHHGWYTARAPALFR